MAFGTVLCPIKNACFLNATQMRFLSNIGSIIIIYKCDWIQDFNIFSHTNTKTCYLKHDTKHIFCFVNTVTQHFLNHIFYIILNNDTKNLQPNSPQVITKCKSYLVRELKQQFSVVKNWKLWAKKKTWMIREFNKECLSHNSQFRNIVFW